MIKLKTVIRQNIGRRLGNELGPRRVNAIGVALSSIALIPVQLFYLSFPQVQSSLHYEHDSLSNNDQQTVQVVVPSVYTIPGCVIICVLTLYVLNYTADSVCRVLINIVLPSVFCLTKYR